MLHAVDSQCVPVVAYDTVFAKRHRCGDSVVMTDEDVIVAYAFLEVFHTYGFTGCRIGFGVFATALKAVQFSDSNRGEISTDSLALCSGGFGYTCIELVTKSDYLCLCRIGCKSANVL